MVGGDRTFAWYEDVIYAVITTHDGEAHGSKVRVGDPLPLSIIPALVTSEACMIEVPILKPASARRASSPIAVVLRAGL